MKTIILLSAALLAAQQSDPNLPLQQIGPNDLLSISVYRAPELTRTARVDSAGEISLPLLSKPIPAAGLLPAAVEQSIAAALKSQNILVNPIVKVTIAEYSSRPVTVTGAVKRPLTFQAAGRITLLDAIARAEGLTTDAGSEILFTRPGAETLHLAAGGPLDHLLTGGEEIRVPEAPRIFVLGNVRKPGSFRIRKPEDASLLRLIAVAEGLLPYAGKIAYIYRRETQQEIPIELAKIMDRKLPDQPLEPEDVLYITDRKGRRAAMGVIDRATGFATATASGVLIWRR
ncbi:MAG: hypothetical protein FJW20_11725 [Acidimicrobiia bacterium]|nr:hypothetical protein [Acidimicrobiia bacterium]